MVGLSIKPPEVKNVKPVFSEIIKGEDIKCYQIPTFLVKFVFSFTDESEMIQPLFKGSRFIDIAVCNNDTRRSDECYICYGLDLSSYLNL